VYTAPTAIATAQQVTVTATSQADATKSASATVALSAVGITVSPLAATLSPGQSQQFTANVTGAANTAVTWSIAPNVGGISPAGVYTAPTAIATAQQVTVTATSQADATKSASATVALTESVTAAPSITITISGQPRSITDQPALTLKLSEPLPFLADAQVSIIAFEPNASALPVSYFPSGTATGAALQFATGGTTATVVIPANSTSCPLPSVQVGDVAGTITVALASLRVSGGGPALKLPETSPSTTITVPRLAPIIAPGSLQVSNTSASGFSVHLVASSTPRDLSGATVTFTPASGAQWNGASFSVPLAGSADAWFSSALGQAAGGAFDLEIPFTFSGDMKAIASVAVTLTNSTGVSQTASVNN
jgi:hypothetical protein